jgi:tetratricopeptide (TPR) repeat protein
MASERIQRQIERLLDEADGASAVGDWETVRARARAALNFDPGNVDATAYLEAAARASGSPVSSEGAGAAVAPAPAAAAEQPAAFADGRYAVRRFLGEGGKKKVYLAHDSLLDRDVAFALIKTEGLDDVGRERVTREAQAMGRLGAHPHIVSIFDLGEHEGQPFVVTELMGGGDVEGLLEGAEGPLPLPRSLDVAKAVARGLVFAHAQGVIHRDLKPGNVWLTADGTAKIGDFGLAVALDKSRLTMHGMMVGTVAYMPPEQALGGEVTPQSDLYSLGAMLYEMVTGRPPFSGGDATAIISQHINTPPVAPSWLTEGCPAELETLIVALLAKAPADRPPSAADVLGRLEAIDPAAPGVRHGDSGANPLDRLARGVFVGREPELERLRGAFDEAFAGRGSLVMLVGEPGIGKTRTAQELATYAGLRGGQVLWGRARESAGAPAYWPWIQIGGSWEATNDLSAGGFGGSPEIAAALVPLFPALRRLMPDLPELAPLHDAEAAQFRLFQAYTDFLRSVADPPLLVILDDLHWADKPSLLLLQHLAQELASMRVLVVGTYRDTDLARTHPLSEALAALNREPGFLRLALRGLTKDETAAYIRTVANVDPAPDVLARIVEETEGNPFFLSEVVNLLTQEGTLARTSLSDIAVPDGVREALGRRLDLISPETNETLQVAAVVGREFAYDTLNLLGERGDDELLRQIEEALAARVIEEMDRPGRYRFTHALMQETLLSELSTTRRIRLHGQVGDALERRWADSPDRHAPELALHFGEAATLSAAHARRAVHYSRLAAEQAEAVAGWDEARHHYQRCLDLLADTSDDLGEDRADLLVRLGRCARDSGDSRVAWRSLREAIELYRRAGDGPAMAHATLDALHVYTTPQQVDRLAHDALAALDGADPHLEALLLVELVSQTLGQDLRTDAERERLAALTAMHEWEDVGAALLLGETFYAYFDASLGVHDSAARFQEAFECFDRLGQPGRAILAANVWASAVSATGDLDAGLAAHDEFVGYARRHGARYLEDLILWYSSLIHEARCDWDAIDRLQAEHRERFPDSRQSRIIDSYRYWRAGRLDDAIAVHPEPDPAIPQLQARDLARLTELLHLAGRDAEEAETFGELRALLDESPNLILHNVALMYLEGHTVQFADDDLLDTFDELLRRHDAQPDPQVGPSPSLQRVYAGYDLARGRVDDAERRYREALAWSERERCPVEAGLCHQGLAEIAERRGDHIAALEHLDAAGSLFAEHGHTYYLDQILAKKEILKA